MSNLDYHDCDVLVIDTVSMNISGEENSNDTWLRFQEHTGLALKRKDITVVRIDHAGKGSAGGPRGGSAKGGSVDAEWRVRRYSDGTMTLKCETHRMPIQDTELNVEIVEDPLLTHRIGHHIFGTSTTQNVTSGVTRPTLAKSAAQINTTWPVCLWLRGWGSNPRPAD